MKPEEIIKAVCDKKHPIVYQLKVHHGSNIEEVKEYMKEIAELAFDAGANHGYELPGLQMRLIYLKHAKYSTKEQFISDLFNTSKTEK